jgi:hypothetical protein
MSRSIPPGAAVTRRSLMKKLAMAAAVTAALPTRRSSAAEPPHLDLKDPAAVAVGYVEDARQVDPKKYPAYTKGSTCENCFSTGSHYRPCSLFPGKAVAIGGWCSGWTAEM